MDSFLKTFKGTSLALPQDFWDRLPTRSDRELLDMLAHPEDYLPEARDALAAELEKGAPPISAQTECLPGV